MPASPQRLIAALQELALDLPQPDIERLANWLALMDVAGNVMNLTGLSNPADMARELVGEALRLLQLGEMTPGSLVMDIGSGNGSPVIPLAVSCPEVSFVAVEARQRRSDFLRLATARLRLTNLRIVCSRVEKLPEELQGPYDIVVSRAFASPAEFIRIANGLIKPAGEIRGMAGDEADSVAQAVSLTGRSLIDMNCYLHGERQRCVYLIR
jgi:16S rRNA (guanine527-N7)-methyltransferase